MMNTSIANWIFSLEAFKVGTLLSLNRLAPDNPSVHEDPVDYSARTTELENENTALRQKLESLERELQCRSPTKSIKSAKKPKVPSLNLTNVRLAAGGAHRDDSLGIAMSKLNSMNLNDPAGAKFLEKRPVKTPEKMMRKLTARKWDLMDVNEIEAFENHHLEMDMFDGY